MLTHVGHSSTKLKIFRNAIAAWIRNFQQSVTIVTKWSPVPESFHYNFHATGPRVRRDSKWCDLKQSKGLKGSPEEHIRTDTHTSINESNNKM